MQDAPWIGVDFDGTLAHYTEWKGAAVLGEPIPEMVERVKGWLAAGHRVKIMTARGSKSAPERLAAFPAIRAWCEKHLGQELEITDRKDYGMIELWDDRAVSVEHNTGRMLGVSRL